MEPLLSPDYLIGKVTEPDWSGPAVHLQDGSWCGHGEPKFRIFDVGPGDDSYQVLLPQSEGKRALIPPQSRLSHFPKSQGFLCTILESTLPACSRWVVMRMKSHCLKHRCGVKTATELRFGFR